MRHSMKVSAWAGMAVVALGAAFAAPAFADDDVRGELEALKRQLRDQERKIRELEGRSVTQDEVTAAVAHYLDATPTPGVLVGGADEAGKCGFPTGGAPFIQQGDSKISIHMRNQVRYEAFLYSDDAVGTLKSPADTLSDAAPRDRSGFEIERLYFGVDGQFICPNLTFNLVLNFDSDQVAGVEKEFAWIDFKYSGEHHVRAGTDKVPFTLEEQTSSAVLAFCDRAMVAKAFALDSDTGVQLWGNFGSCDCPKQFLYKFMLSTGEGPIHSAGSVFGTDAWDTYSDQLLISGCFEWTITCKDWKPDEVDNRSCEERCRLDAALGVAAYYENDDDVSLKAPGALVVRGTGPLQRQGIGAWFRARWQGFTMVAEAMMREVDFTAGSAAPTQTDTGATIMVHYRFPSSPWGVGVRAGCIWLDDDYKSITVGLNNVAIEDTITEFGIAVNYFAWDHANKVTADVTWVQDNSGVKSSGPGYFWDPTKGIVIEDGIMFRIQWQVNI